MSGAHQIAAQVLAGAHQIPRGFFFGREPVTCPLAGTLMLGERGERTPLGDRKAHSHFGCRLVVHPQRVPEIDVSIEAGQCVSLYPAFGT